MTITKIRPSAILEKGDKLENLANVADAIVANHVKFSKVFENKSEVIVTHNLHRFPAVTVVDSAGTEFKPSVTHTSDVELRVQLLVSMSGTIHCA